MFEILELQRSNIEQLLGVRAELIDFLDLQSAKIFKHLNPLYRSPQFLTEHLKNLQSGDLIQLTDPFMCQYLCVRMENWLLLCGPYLNALPDRNQLNRLLLQNHFEMNLKPELNKFLSFVPICEDFPLVTAIRIGCNATNGVSFELKYQHFHQLPDETVQQHVPPKDSQTTTMHLIENSYLIEDQMLLAVARGDRQTALDKLAELMRTGARHIRTGDRLRDERNLCFVLSALLRKTVQQVGVHPIYLDANSGEFARQIEQCQSNIELDRVRIKMVRTYCELVDHLKIERFSLPVRKALNFINLNLSAQLPVDRIAQEIGCSSNYLSTVFNREVKKSITEYVHEQRLSEAADLLRKTNLSIQSIAAFVGYTDTNYFSRLFRINYQQSPSVFRKTINLNTPAGLQVDYKRPQ